MAIVREPNPDVVITHPNRESAASKSMRLIVIAVLAAGAILLAIITVGSSGAQAGALGLQVLLGLLLAYFAYAVINWRSGVLPIAAGTAIFAGVFAAVSISGWSDRAGTGYKEAPLPVSLIAILIALFAILQLVTVIVCLKAFTQQWQVELEVPRHGAGPAAV